MSTYSVWRDHATGTYEVVMWNERHPTVIQAGIKTQETAHKARDRWQEKEARLIAKRCPTPSEQP